jgi:LysR family transcriptional regulator, transcription activator of glutamate synthase operon
VTPTIAFEGTDITTLRGLIGARLGVAILPRSSAPSPDIVEIAVDDDHLVRPIAIGWMANRFLPPSAAVSETAHWLGDAHAEHRDYPRRA